MPWGWASLPAARRRRHALPWEFWGCVGTGPTVPLRPSPVACRWGEPGGVGRAMLGSAGPCTQMQKFLCKTVRLLEGQAPAR